MPNESTDSTTSSTTHSAAGEIIHSGVHGLLHAGVHAAGHAVPGLDKYLGPKLAISSVPIDFYHRMNNDEDKGHSTEQKVTCAAVGTGTKTAVNFLGCRLVNAATVAAAPETFGASLLLNIAGYGAADWVANKAGNASEAVCHASHDFLRNRAEAQKQAVKNEAFAKLSHDQLIELGQIIRTSAEAEQKAVNQDLNTRLQRLFCDDKAAIVEAKKHIDNLREFNAKVLSRCIPAVSAAASRNDCSADAKSSPHTRLTFSEFAKQTASNLLPLNDTFQWCGQLGALIGNQDLQRIGAVGSGLIQMVSHVTNLSSALSQGLGPMAALNPAFAAMGVAVGIIGLFAKKKKKTQQEDPHLKAMMQMTNIIVGEIHGMRKAMHAEFKQVNQKLNHIIDQIHSLTSIVLKGFETLEVLIKAGFEEQHIANAELKAIMHDIQSSVARSQEVILAALTDKELEPFHDELFKIKKWLELSAKQQPLDDEELSEIKQSAKTLVAYLGENNRLSRGIHSGQHFAQVNEPLHVSVCADDVLKNININTDSRNAMASKMGYLAATAQRLMSGFNDKKDEKDYLSAQPQQLTFNRAATFNPITWSYGVSYYRQLRNVFSYAIKDPNFSQIKSIIAAGNQQLELIETLQSPALIRALFNHYQQAAHDVIGLINSAFDKQNQILFQEMLRRFPNKEARYKLAKAIDLGKDLKSAVEDFKAVVPGNSSIQGKLYTFPAYVKKSITVDYKNAKSLFDQKKIDEKTRLRAYLVSRNLGGNGVLPVVQLDEPVTMNSSTPATNTLYEHCVIHSAQFPSEFVLAEYWGLGNFRMDYTYQQKDFDGNNVDRQITFYFSHNAKDYYELLTIFQQIRNKSLDPVNQTIVNSAHFAVLKQEIEVKLHQALLSERKKAVKYLIDNQHENGLEIALRKLTTYRSLLIAFGHVTGLSENRMQIVGELLSGAKVEADLRAFIQTNDVNTPLPQNVLFGQLSNKQQTFFANMTNADPHCFQSAFATQIVSDLMGLSLTAQMEHIQRQNEMEDKKEELQEKQQPLQIEAHKNLQKLMIKYEKLIKNLWGKLWMRWLEKLPVQAENPKEVEDDDVYKNCRANINIAKHKLNALQQMLADHVINKSEITKAFLELRELCIEIHADLKSLNNYVENGKEYTISDRETEFLNEKNLYPKEVMVAQTQNKLRGVNDAKEVRYTKQQSLPAASAGSASKLAALSFINNTPMGTAGRADVARTLIISNQNLAMSENQSGYKL